MSKWHMELSCKASFFESSLSSSFVSLDEKFRSDFMHFHRFPESKSLDMMMPLSNVNVFL